MVQERERGEDGGRSKTEYNIMLMKILILQADA